MSEVKENRGWAYPTDAASKEHYFTSTMAMCGKWAYFGPCSPTDSDTQERATRCKECLKRWKRHLGRNISASASSAENPPCSSATAPAST